MDDMETSTATSPYPNRRHSSDCFRVNRKRAERPVIFSIAHRHSKGLRRTRSNQAVLTLLAVLLTLMTACSDSNGNGTDAASSYRSELMTAAHDSFYAATAALINPSPEYYQTLKECMNEQGFDYEDPSPPQSIISIEELTELIEQVTGLDRTSSLFRDRYGYGVSTIGVYLAVRFVDDPNSEYFAGMSASDRQAWNAAAYGEAYVDISQEAQAAGGEEDFYFQMGGCTRAAEEASDFYPEQLQDGSFGWWELLDRIEASQGYVELEQEWARCAADQGYPQFTTVESLTDYLDTKLQEIEVKDPFAGMTERDIASLSNAELRAMKEAQQRLYGQGLRYDLDVLSELQKEELELAQQLNACDIAYWTGFDELVDIQSPDG